MNISDNSKKMEIISRLIADGAIDFEEALILLEKETEFYFQPGDPALTFPSYPQWPQYSQPVEVTCHTN